MAQGEEDSLSVILHQSVSHRLVDMCTKELHVAHNPESVPAVSKSSMDRALTKWMTHGCVFTKSWLPAGAAMSGSRVYCFAELW